MMTPDEQVAKAQNRPDFAPPSGRARWLFLGVSVALLALLLASGVLAAGFLNATHRQQLAMTHALAERTQMLSGLSLSIQNYNQAVQQFVTQSRAEQEQTSRQSLDQLMLGIESELRSYPLDRDPGEEELLGGLRDVFAEQRTLYIAVLQNAPNERRLTAQHLIAEIIPLQKKVLDWSVRLREWNAEKLRNSDQARVDQLAEVQEGLRRSLAIGLGSGLLLALAGLAYIVRLERQTSSRYIQLVQSGRELRQLSERLVDAQETERRSIARELHDEIGQALGALLVDLGRLEAMADDRPEMRAQLENMKSLTERTFQSVRNIALLLRPSMLDDLGLVAALEWQGREVSRRSEIEVEVQSENVSDDLPDEYKICVYRLVQEALNNAVRHSQAKNAKVMVWQSEGRIAVLITDDGRGFDAQRTRGLGLLGMEERVKRLGGRLTIESRPGDGVVLKAELPFPRASGAAS